MGFSLPLHSGLGSRNGACGSTTPPLLQVAFPALPDDLETVDVQLATVPPFWRVPVTPPGMLPLASYPTDLTRARGANAGYCQYEAVHATARLGSAISSWSMPFTPAAASPRLPGRSWRWSRARACGPRRHHRSPTQSHRVALQPDLSGGTPDPGRHQSDRVASPAGDDASSRVSAHWNAFVPTCGSGLRALRQTGQQMRVITNLPPVPSGTSKVDIVFPGLTTFADVAVTPAPDSTFRSAGPAVRECGSGPIGRTSHILAGDHGTGRPHCRGRTSYGTSGNGRRDCPLSGCRCRRPLGHCGCRRKLADQLDHIGDGVGDSGWTVGEPLHVLTFVEPVSTRMVRIPASRPETTSVSIRSPTMIVVSE